MLIDQFFNIARMLDQADQRPGKDAWDRYNDSREGIGDPRGRGDEGIGLVTPRASARSDLDRPPTVMISNIMPTVLQKIQKGQRTGSFKNFSCGSWIQ